MAATDTESSEEESEELLVAGGNGKKSYATPMAESMAALKQTFSQKIAFMFVCVPIAWFFHFTMPDVEETPLPHFISNFGAIIPLAWLISECTEHLEKKVGETIGVLLNCSFGNIVEIILSIQAIQASKTDPSMLGVVKASLLGAMLMNLLFVLGCCFFVSGLKYHSYELNQTVASYNLTLLAVASMGLIVPTTLAVFDEESLGIERLTLSRGIALSLAFMYMQWLFFNLSSHAHIFDGKNKTTVAANELRIIELEEKLDKMMGMPKMIRTPSFDAQERKGVQSAVVPMNAGSIKKESDGEEGEETGPTMTVPMASGILLFCTVLVAFQCDFLVESINPVAETYRIKKAFIATVLLPMVGNFSEVIAAITIAYKGNIDMAMGVCMSSAVQIATLAIPASVIIAWVVGVPLDLDFETYQVKLLFSAIVVSSLSLQDGQANWLKGSMLMTTYIILAASFWVIHDMAGVDEMDTLFGNSTQLDNLKELIEEHVAAHLGGGE